jgi:hypothetical protein
VKDWQEEDWQGENWQEEYQETRRKKQSNPGYEKENAGLIESHLGLYSRPKRQMLIPNRSLVVVSLELSFPSYYLFF